MYKQRASWSGEPQINLRRDTFETVVPLAGTVPSSAALGCVARGPCKYRYRDPDRLHLAPARRRAPDLPRPRPHNGLRSASPGLAWQPPVLAPSFPTPADSSFRGAMRRPRGGRRKGVRGIINHNNNKTKKKRPQVRLSLPNVHTVPWAPALATARRPSVIKAHAHTSRLRGSTAHDRGPHPKYRRSLLPSPNRPPARPPPPPSSTPLFLGQFPGLISLSLSPSAFRSGRK